MSYSVAPAPGPKTRPGVVATASLLLYAAAVLLLVSAGLGLLQIGPAKTAADVAYADDPDIMSAIGSVLTIVFVAIGVIYLLLAIGLIVLGLLVGKGKQPARVITWVVGGLAVLCLGCTTASAGLSAGGLGAGSMGGGSGSAAQNEEFARLLAENTPAWVSAASTIIVVISLIMMIAVIILLALPASNDYFRKEQQVWVPPTAPWPADPNNFPPPPPPGATL